MFEDDDIYERMRLEEEYRKEHHFEGDTAEEYRDYVLTNMC